MKNKRKTKVRCAVNGAQTNSSMGQGIAFDASALGSSLQGIGSLFGMISGNSTATTDSQVATQSINNVLGGAATGAQVGAIAGPVGMAAGAVGGAILGGIGKSGEKANMTSFTDYNEGTLSTGLKGLFGNSGLKRERRRIKSNAYNNKAAVAGTSNLENEFNYDYGQLDTNSFANGGMLPQSLAYLDDGELVQTPDGNIGKVPEQGNPTDSNLVNLPDGSKILSDNLIVPGTKETFAQIGEKLMSKNKSKNSDRFAQNSKKMNEMNNSIIHNQLFDLQEQLKLNKGIKPKTKTLKYADGGIKRQPKYDTIRVTEKPVWDTIPTNPKSMNTSLTSTGIGLGKTANLYNSSKALSDKITNPTNNKSSNINIGSTLSNLASNIATLMPIFDNITSSDYTPVSDIQNPYSSTVSRAMRNRRYDINPTVRDLTNNRSINRYNLSQINTNTGANLAYGLQSAVNLDKAIEDVRSQESNINNQYIGDYANTLNNLGQQWVNGINSARSINMQGEANARNIRRTGLSQLSQYAQNNLLMRNQASRDDAMLDLYRPLLSAGFSQDILNDVYNNYVRGGNRYGG